MSPYSMKHKNCGYSGAESPGRDGHPVPYFNTNTFLAPTVMAAQLALQEKQSRDEYVVIGAHEFSAAVMAPVAAVGDALFWGGLRPLAALVAVFFALHGAVLAPISVLLIFTLPSIMVRLGGSLSGYIRDAQVVALIQQLRLADFAVILKQINMVVLGAITAILCVKFNGQMDLSDAAFVPLALLVLLVLYASVFLLRRKMPVVIILALILTLVCASVCLEQIQALV